jgi:predicted GTPase
MSVRQGDATASGITALTDSVEAHWRWHGRGAVARDGVRVVLADPPNGGKSTLLNALFSAGGDCIRHRRTDSATLIEVPVALDGDAARVYRHCRVAGRGALGSSKTVA